DMKRAKAEKDFGTPQDVTKAKERVMNHLKERHPSTKEETIKDKAKINHLKGNIKTSKLIGRNIAD
ncbi:MAG: hypothetical protein IKO06_01435, partial [Alphaproteobacteria bacterium]|nr:hypothetical protein [Alphaproteobacteria bacterium]